MTLLTFENSQKLALSKTRLLAKMLDRGETPEKIKDTSLRKRRLRVEIQNKALTADAAS